jgi:hypothetical protein
MAPCKVSLFVLSSMIVASAASTALAQTQDDWRAAQAQSGEPPKLVLEQSYHGTTPGAGNALPRVEEIKGKEGNWVTWPGFMMRPDSGSRLFLQATKDLTYEKTVTKNRVRLVFKDAQVFLHNNSNPLVTMNFNTPLKTAYLKRHKKSVELVMELKVPAEVVITQASDADGYCYLFVDFPIGAFETGGDWHPVFSGDMKTPSAGTWGNTPSASTPAAPGAAAPPAPPAAPEPSAQPAAPAFAPPPQPEASPASPNEEPPAQDPESEIFPAT